MHRRTGLAATLLWALTVAAAAPVAAPVAATPHGARPVAAALGQFDEADDPALMDGLQWNLYAVGAPAAWTVSTGRGITVAVVDTGVDRHHPDLEGKVLPGATCTGSAGDPDRCRPGGEDGNGHGTHVAGIIAARTADSFGVASVAPDAQLLPVRVLEGCPGCPAEGAALDVAAGIRWAVARGADVVNLSLGSSTGSADRLVLADAVADAWAAGVVVVAAAGTATLSASSSGDEPAVVVTALARAGGLPAYARRVPGGRWGLAAPGGERGDTAATCRPGGAQLGIVSTWWDPARGEGPHACLAGTSMAAPHVAGAAALLRAAGWSPAQAVRRLLATARDLGPPGADDFYGAGALDVAAALGVPASTSGGDDQPAPAPDPGAEGSGALAGPGGGHAAPATFGGDGLRGADRRDPLPWLAGSVVVAVTVWVQIVLGLRRRRAAPPPDG